MKLNLPTIIFLVLFLGIIAFIVYANAAQPDMTGQVPAIIPPRADSTATNAPELEELQEDKPNLTDEELRKKVLPANDLLFPDLVLADPTRVVIQRGEGVKRLLFDTAFANLGIGDLHVYSTEEVDRFTATQIIKSSSGSEYHVSVGDFQFKNEHDHWHLANFANYELWSVGDNGIRDELVASSVKVSFCIWDYGEYTEGDFDLTGDDLTPKARQYPECEHEEQGLTVGWFDLYDPFTAGQTIDILNVPDGVYILRTLINVNEEILELEKSNNESKIFIEIIGNAAFILKQPDAMMKILRPS
jgi:hypothetical protein